MQTKRRMSSRGVRDKLGSNAVKFANEVVLSLRESRPQQVADIAEGGIEAPQLQAVGESPQLEVHNAPFLSTPGDGVEVDGRHARTALRIPPQRDDSACERGRALRVAGRQRKNLPVRFGL